METTTVYLGYVGVMEKKMEATIVANSQNECGDKGAGVVSKGK